jgi:hypothetical protein
MYDCFCDGIPQSLERLDSMYPRARFILQVRDLESWIYSRLAHIDRLKTRSASSKNWDTSASSVKHWITQRNTHHISVLRYFADRPGDLLVVNYIRDRKASSKIGDFLGVAADPWRPRRNINRARHRPSKYTAMLRQCIVDLGITEDEIENDILCPSLLSPEALGRYPVDTSMVDSPLESE